eukprot:12060474-Ditylum_brightwellii.AAC.1
MIDFCEHAKTSGSTGVNLVNVENKNKFTRYQVHYVKMPVKQVKGLSGAENISDTDSSIIESTDGRLMCQEVVDNTEQQFEDQAIDVYNEEEKNDIFSFC